MPIFVLGNKLSGNTQIRNKNFIMFDEKNIQFLISKGISLYKLKKFSEAVDYFNKAIKINPLYCTAWCNKGVALDKLGQHNEALDCFNKAIKINPLYCVIFHQHCTTLSPALYQPHYNS